MASSSARRIVAKFGGSSLADSGQFRKVRSIVEADPARELVVVSAPGKADGGGHKVTDMLYMCEQLASHDLGFADVFAIIEQRYRGIVADLGLSTDIDAALASTRALISSGATPGHVASRGEWLNGLILADLLGWELVDAVEVIVMSESGELDLGATVHRLHQRLPAGTRAVVPGFYGASPSGRVHTLARGGSDITGALVARGVGADLYENWTDVSGLLVADPSVIPGAQPIGTLTYAELRELSYMGAKVLQEESIFPVREAGIPIRVCNTNAPESPGTLIVPELESDSEAVVSGIAGKRDYAVISVEKARMRTHGDFLRKLLSVFESNDLVVEHMPSGIDSVSVIVDERELRAKEARVLEGIRIYCSPDHVSVARSLALVAVVGHGMIHRTGASARILGALAGAGVNIRLIIQGASELNVLVGVDNADFVRATRAIHAEFMDQEGDA